MDTDDEQVEGISGRHVIVTGAGTGIGRSIALRLGAGGARLTLLARRLAPLRETAERVTAAGGGRCHVAAVDIRDGDAVDAAFDQAAAALGPVRALVANAGIGGPNEPGPEDRFEDLVATNLTGTYRCARAAQRHLEPGPAVRHMVLISSILGRIGVPGYTGYCASKSALLGLARALAMELAPDGVQVNALCPGWVNTSMAHEGLEGLGRAVGVSKEEAFEIAMKDVPLGRMSEPEEVAGVVAWLVSGDARGVTGQGLDVNGGAWM